MPRLEKNSTGVWVLATNRRGDEIVLARRHAGAALAAAALGAIGRHRHALDVAAVGDGDDHVLALDQVLDVLLELVVEDLGAARRRELLLDLEQLLAHQREQLVAVAQQLEIALDQLGDLAQLLGDLVALQPGQALQAQLEDGAGLRLGQPVGAVGRRPRGPARRSARSAAPRRTPASPWPSAARARPPDRARGGSSRSPRRCWRRRWRGRPAHGRGRAHG